MKHARKDYNRIQDPAGLIPDDEPVFLLRGQDELADEIVDAYADLLELVDGDPEQVRLCREQAEAMRKWRPRKYPDLAKLR